MKSILIAVLAFLALSCIVSGLVLVAHPNGGDLIKPVNLLGPTPFKDFLIPGIILTAVIGGINLLAVIFNIQHRDSHYNWSLAGGIVVIVWILAEMMMIKAASWLHFLFLGCGVLIMLLSLRLKAKSKLTLPHT